MLLCCLEPAHKPKQLHLHVPFHSGKSLLLEVGFACYITHFVCRHELENRGSIIIEPVLQNANGIHILM